jgi:hypothetical protein
VRTDSYLYTIYDADGQEALGYHYHPRGRGEDQIPAPHLHVFQSGPVCGAYLPQVHLRTGRVALEDVVELLITDFQVESRLPDWEAVLDRARAHFAGARSWASWQHIESPFSP